MPRPPLFAEYLQLANPLAVYALFFGSQFAIALIVDWFARPPKDEAERDEYDPAGWRLLPPRPRVPFEIVVALGLLAAMLVSRLVVRAVP